MENNEGRTIQTTAAVEGVRGQKAGAETVLPPSGSVSLSEEEMNEKLRIHVSSLGDIIDSPKELLILRNIILTLLELPEHQFDLRRALELATDVEEQARAIQSLKQETPQYWSADWNSIWKKDADPLLSFSQQEATSRARLVTFWESEWNTIPIEQRNHVAAALKGILSR